MKYGAWPKNMKWRKVILFGSRARGDFREKSDIDLAVEGGDLSGFPLM